MTHVRSRTRNASLRRVLMLWQALDAQPRTTESLATQLGVTSRTVYRDLALLREVGAKVWREEATGRWKIARGVLGTPQRDLPREATA